MAPGAFFVLAALTAIQNAVKMKKKGVKALSEAENCASCSLNCGCNGFCPEKNKEAK
jgi:radical SAM protein with 4Fe4S-binding SPASM domain